jgi:hypothetical protein
MSMQFEQFSHDIRIALFHYMSFAANHGKKACRKHGVGVSTPVFLDMNKTVAVPDFVTLPDRASEHVRRVLFCGLIVIGLKVGHAENAPRVVEMLCSVGSHR